MQTTWESCLFLWMNKKAILLIAFSWCSFGFSYVVVFFWPLHRFESYEKESQKEITHRLSRLISSQDPEAKARLHSPKVNIQLLVIGTWFKGKSHWAKRLALSWEFAPSSLPPCVHCTWLMASWLELVETNGTQCVVHRQGRDLKM